MNASSKPSVPGWGSLIERRLLFVVGKGGVGKTAISKAIAQAQAKRGRRTLWVSFGDLDQPAHEIRQAGPNLWQISCDPADSFEEYAKLKIGVASLAHLFVGNRLVRYLAKAAPGIAELVLLGKVWHERLNYERVVVDMPSTGYGLAMFQSTRNFSRLFTGGPIHRDAEAMLETFGDPAQTGQLIVALPEEMPLQEALELEDFILEQFPGNQPGFLVNRCFPRLDEAGREDPDSWPSPVPASLADYARKRGVLEERNLALWTKREIVYASLPYFPPADGRSSLVDAIAERVPQGAA